MMTLKKSAMIFFSGFSFCNEIDFFKPYLKDNDFTVAGFSMGSIDAFEYCLDTKKRIDTLQLFSPAFFQDRDDKYKRLQLMFFNKNKKEYYQQFIKNTFYPCVATVQNECIGKKEELNKLLFYKWSEDQLKLLSKKGIKLEVYLGQEDKIINSNNASEFFRNFGIVYFIKKVGHILSE